MIASIFKWTGTFTFTMILCLFSAFATETTMILHRIYKKFEWPAFALYSAITATLYIYGKAVGQNLLAELIVGPYQQLPITLEYARFMGFTFGVVFMSALVAFIYNLIFSVLVGRDTLFYATIRFLGKRFKLLKALQKALQIEDYETTEEAYKIFSNIGRFTVSLIYVAIVIEAINKEDNRIMKLAKEELVAFAFNHELIRSHDCDLPEGTRVTFSENDEIFIGTISGGKLNLTKSVCKPVVDETQAERTKGLKNQ